MIRNSKKYSIEVNKIGQDVAISISLELEMSPELAELILRDMRTDVKDFNEARILSEIIRDPVIIYSLCQRIEEVKNQDVRYEEMRHQDGRNQEVPDWNMHTTA